MAFHILHTLKHGAELPPEVVNYMYTSGAFMILKDFPEGHEFGIDYKSWTVGPKFMGLKMIPAGVHFVYCSVKGAPRIGFFHNFKSEEVLAKRWDKVKETFSDDVLSDEEVSRIRASLKTIDSHLGPYPFENYRSWYALTDFVTGETLDRLNPLKGQISAQAELVSMETCLMENEQLNATVGCSNSVDREHPTRTRFVDPQGLPIMKIREGYEIRFIGIPQLRVGENRVGIDYTDRLERVIRQLNGDWKQLLAEVQFAFACFLIGQVFEGFEQWKRLIHLLCCCPSALGPRSDMYISFIRVLFFELKECPTDFFVDIVSRDNFLTTTLSMLFANIRDSDIASTELKKKSAQFKLYLTKEFKWDFECD
ncbi:hypothetical protein V3C99_011039 [Haemonchus contortus]|uniref:Protein AAR2 homolog n=1 Tax=Haemonchus contortus TaxID=6289 RepID=A0A7I4Y8B7_HAECO